MNYDDVKRTVVGAASNKRLQWAAALFVLFIVLFLSSSIRLSNWDLLTDHTTGEKIPLALDPYYFLRMAETIVEGDGVLPEFDEMRVTGFNTPWHTEIMPYVVVFMWKASGAFGDYTLREVDIFSPVFFYFIGLVLFFCLVYALTKSKFTSALSSAFLAFAPGYLYRTMAGFSDHEAIGMIGFFSAMIGFVLTMKYLDSLKKRNLVGACVAGVVMGVLTSFTAACWAGVSTFLFMIIPIGFLIFWTVKMQDKGNAFGDNGLLYYLLWIVSSVVFSVLFGNVARNTINSFFTSNRIIGVAVLGFVIIDWLLVLLQGKINFSFYHEKDRVFYSVGLLVLLGMIALPLVGKNFFGMLWEILNRLLNPLWNASRLDVTVAENSQPYLLDWIANTGKVLFSLFVLGIIFVCIKFSEGIRSTKGKALLAVGAIAMFFGILFSRISSSSILNGNGIFSLSGLIYLGGVALFIYSFFRIYRRERMSVSPLIAVVFSWVFVMLVTGRSTTRLFFAIAPLACFCGAYAVLSLFEYLRKKKLDEILKVLIVGLFVVSIIASGAVIRSSYNSVSAQAMYTGPSANAQWQSAMSWVRENTTEGGAFAHWWDYGYWVETLGERPAIADGGHAQSVYDGNHKLGRYVLTTPQPDTALSFFKTMGINYLLIDQTDLGKYPAYSKIGGGDGEDELDRYSAIPVMPNDPKQTVETANGTMVVFSGGMYLFEDILYNDGNKNVFLPAQKAAVVGVIMNLEGNSLKQPEIVYLYNNIQTRIPARYVYVNGEIIDFGSGLDVVLDVIPSFTGTGINQMGAVIYLSQKVSKSLFAQLYLMDDVFGNYETLELVHSEPDSVVEALQAQGANFGDFIYYQGFRGPIKIWDVSEVPEEIKVVEEFKEPFNGVYGSLDDLEFR